jgi:DNA helicase-2/ATP-dependent DNA helicase PcrA
LGCRRLVTWKLKGNYRSTQRIIDLYRLFRPGVRLIQLRAEYAHELGIITFDSQMIALDELSTEIASLIPERLATASYKRDLLINEN